MRRRHVAMVTCAGLTSWAPVAAAATVTDVPRLAGRILAPRADGHVVGLLSPAGNPVLDVGDPVEETDAAGLPVRSWGTFGNAAGEIATFGTQLGVDAAGNVTIADPARLQTFSSTGTPLASASLAGGLPLGLAVSPDAATVFVHLRPQTGPDVVRVVDRALAPTAEWSAPSAVVVSGIAAGAGGEALALLEAAASVPEAARPPVRVARIGPGGALIGDLAGTASGTGALTATRARLFPDGNGLVYVSAADGSVSRYAVAGGFRGSWRLPPDLASGSFVAATRDALVGNGPLFGHSQRAWRASLGLDTEISVPASVVAGVAVPLDARGSELPFGSIVAYRWDLDGDGTYEVDTGARGELQRTFRRATSGTVGVQATGSDGSTGTARAPVTVRPNLATARIAAPARALSGRRTALDATTSAVTGGKVVRHVWDLDGDGSFETGGPRVVHRFRHPGRRRVRLRVTSPDGHSDVSTRLIDVRPAPPSGPTGVSIDGGAARTTARCVTLHLTWPAFATAVLISNDGGFRRKARRRVAARLPWCLDSWLGRGDVATVHVRFTGSGRAADAERAYTDEIAIA